MVVMYTEQAQVTHSLVLAMKLLLTIVLLHQLLAIVMAILKSV